MENVSLASRWEIRERGGKMSGSKGLVSCVTPVYNGEGFVGRLLNSVLGQTWPHMEMILVDDGSEDNTLAVAES